MISDDILGPGYNQTTGFWFMRNLGRREHQMTIEKPEFIWNPYWFKCQIQNTNSLQLSFLKITSDLNLKNSYISAIQDLIQSFKAGKIFHTSVSKITSHWNFDLSYDEFFFSEERLSSSTKMSRAYMEALACQKL